MESASKKISNLVQISTMVTQSADFFSIKDKIIEKMLEVVHPTKACVNLFYNNNYKYTYLVCSQTLKEIPNLFPIIKPTGVKVDFNIYPEYIHDAVREKKIIYIKDVFEDERAERERDLALKEGYVGRIIFPLISNNNVVGFMTCFLSKTDKITSSDIDFISSVASLLSLSIDITIKNRDVNQLVEKLRNSISIINEATKKLHINKNINEYLKDLSEQSCSITNSKEAIILIYEKENNQAIFTTYDSDKTDIVNIELLIKDILDNKEIGNFDNEVNKNINSKLFISSYIYHKLIDNDEVIGGIVCVNSEGYTQDDLDILGILSRQVTVGIQMYRYNSFEVKHKLLANELNILNKQQRLIMDKGNFSVNSQKELYFYHKPARVVGGDFYHAIRVDENKVAYIVADVMGHGIVSNYVVAMIKGAFKILAKQYSTPGEILTNLNKILFDEFDKMGVFTTCLVSILDTLKNEITISNAGHYSPIMIQRDGVSSKCIKCTKGIPIGILEDAEYENNIHDISDYSLVCMYTDGVLEIKNETKEEYGLERLEKFLQTNYKFDRDQIIDNLKSELTSFAHSDKFEDDILVVMLQDM